MKKFQITWRFADGYDAPRTNVIEAKDQQRAIKIIQYRHLDLDSPTRSRIEIIKVVTAQDA